MSKRKPIEKKSISQEWLTTYSDMVTLILTFFVLLYAYSLVDTRKFQAVADSLASALNGSGKAMFEMNVKTGDVPIVGEEIPGKDVKIGPMDYPSDKDIYDKVTEFVNENSMTEYVTIKESARGVIIEFKDKILFDPGKAEIKDEGAPALRKISGLIEKMPNMIVIEGHTDNVPIRTARFPSNWELSFERAITVLRYLTDTVGISPKRCSAAAYGEYGPIAENDTPEGRAQNRRVNILIVTTKEEPVKKE